jgi:hypothetical protein
MEISKIWKICAEKIGWENNLGNFLDISKEFIKTCKRKGYSKKRALAFISIEYQANNGFEVY